MPDGGAPARDEENIPSPRDAQQDTRQDSRRDGQGIIHAGDMTLERAGDRVQRERLPLWRSLRRGRAVAIIYGMLLIAVFMLALAAHTFTLLPGDLPLAREIQEHPSPLLLGFFEFISWFGFMPWSALTSAAVIVAMLALRLRLEAAFLVLALGADAIAGIIKLLVGRHRPTSDLVTVAQTLQSKSFPSGHTIHYTVFFGFLIFVLFVNFRLSAARNIAMLLLGLLIVFVGPSRVYLGEHWPTDVIGGYLIGLLYLVPLVLVYLWTRTRVAQGRVRWLAGPRDHHEDREARHQPRSATRS